MTQKQCHLCGADSDNKYKCKTCSKAHNERNQRRRQTRKDAGLCPDCGYQSQLGRILCDKCCERNRIGKKCREKTRSLSGKCVNCDKPRVPDRRLCGNCAEDTRNYKVRRALKFIASGLCTLCGKEPYMPNLKDVGQITRLCQRCHLERKSAQRLGSTQHWKSLLSILDRQNWICPYSGDNIILGDNDSVDHILPISKYPDREFDITNVQWTTQVINIMKSNLIDCEFLTEIEKIVKYLGDDLPVRATSKIHPLPTRKSKLFHRLNQP